MPCLSLSSPRGCSSIPCFEQSTWSMLLLLLLLLLCAAAQEVVVIQGDRLNVRIELRAGLELPGYDEGEAALQLMNQSHTRLARLASASNTNPSHHLDALVLLVNAMYYSSYFSCQYREFVIAEPTHGCSYLTKGTQDGGLAGKYLIVTRGTCSVHAKAQQAEQRGAAGVVVIAAEGEGLGRAVERDPDVKSDEQIAAERQCRRSSFASLQEREDCLLQAKTLTSIGLPVIAASQASLRRWREEQRQASEGARKLLLRATPPEFCAPGPLGGAAQMLPEGGLVVGGAVYAIVAPTERSDEKVVTEKEVEKKVEVVDEASASSGVRAELCGLLLDAAAPRRLKASALRRAAALGLSLGEEACRASEEL